MRLYKKTNNYTILMGDFHAQIWKNKPNGNGNGRICAPIKKRKRRHFRRIGYIKKLQNHEYHATKKQGDYGHGHIQTE